MRIFLDTNFIVNLLVETEFTQRARDLVERYIEDEFLTSITVHRRNFIRVKKTHKKTK
jgi:hypothetical protein